MKRFVITTMILALVATPALAQQRGPKTTRSDDQKRMDSEIDKQYQRVIQSTTDKSKPPPVTDPWGSVRATSSTPDKR